MAYVNTKTAPTFSFFAHIDTAIETVATRYKQHRLYRATFTELNNLSDRDLADIGLHRANLRSVALEASRAQ